ncbi:MAG: DUF1848 domain-containing protein [Calditrichia bacterium]
MDQVISASRRTDIPAFYLRWFMEHLKKGEMEVPNPFNRRQVKRIQLQPEFVGWIVFWSRNYHLYLKNREFFADYRLFFHFTINPPNDILEPDMIDPRKAFQQMEKLVACHGPERIIWRYDPITYYQWRGTLCSNHQADVFREYAKIVGSLGIRRCYTSIATVYPKMIKRAQNFPTFNFLEPALKHQRQILHDMAEIAADSGIQLFICSNDKLVNEPLIQKGHCIDGRLLNQIGRAAVSEIPLPTRPDCGCTASIDIGDYLKTPCKYNCLYCYARR